MSTVGVFALKVRFVFRMLKENLMKLVKEVLLLWGRARGEFHRE